MYLQKDSIKYLRNTKKSHVIAKLFKSDTISTFSTAKGHLVLRDISVSPRIVFEVSEYKKGNETKENFIVDPICDINNPQFKYWELITEEQFDKLLIKLRMK